MQKLRRVCGCFATSQPGFTSGVRAYAQQVDGSDGKTNSGRDAAGSKEQTDNNSQTCSAALKPLLRALQQGLPVYIANFQLNQQEALQRFEIYQQQRCSWMHAHGVLAKTVAAMSQQGSASNSSSNSTPGNSSKTKYPGGYFAGSVRTGPAVRSQLGFWPVHMPFWCFDVVVSAEAKGHIGFTAPSGKEVLWKETYEWARISDHQAISHMDPLMQAYASYQSTREIGDGAKTISLLHANIGQAKAETVEPDSATNLSSSSSSSSSSGSSSGGSSSSSESEVQVRLLSLDEALSGTSRGCAAVPQGAVMQPVEMKQGVAWQLVHRALVHRHVQLAVAVLREQTGAGYVKDVHVRLMVHERRPRLLNLPAFIARYPFGSRHLRGTAGNAEPELYDALIGGTAEGHIVAARHMSLLKVVTAATASVVGMGALTGHAAVATGWVANSTAWAAEITMLSTIVASFAGVWARSLAQTDRDRITSRMIAADNVFHQEYLNRETRTAESAAVAAKAAEESGEAAAEAAEKDQLSDEYMQWLWMDADWRRWGEDEPWNWNPEKQHQAADRLWLQQVRRRIERQRFVQRLRNAKERRMRDSASEDRRERMFGASHRKESHHFTEDHGMGAGRNAAERYPSRRRDFLGYYKLLGMDTEGEISTDGVKAAFKATAMQLHPDRFVNKSAEAQKSANVRFQKLQIAYDVLRDPDKRSQYDRGTLTLH